MQIKTKNTIRFPKDGTRIQRPSKGLIPRIKRITADDVTPVILEVEGGDSTSISSGDFIYSGRHIAPQCKGREVLAPVGVGDTFTLQLNDSEHWNAFPIENVEFHSATQGQIRRISADGVFPIMLEYDDNVDIQDISVGNYINYAPIPETIDNLTYRKIINIDIATQTIQIADFNVTDPSTHGIAFDSFPTSFTTEWTWNEVVQIIQSQKSGSGTIDIYDVFFEVRGIRTENIMIYANWDYPNNTQVNILPEYYGFFYDDKVAKWFSKDDKLDKNNYEYYSDTVETVTGNVSEFEPRELLIDGAMSPVIPLNVPANTRFVKLTITNNQEETGGTLVLDIDENSIGKRR